MSFIIKDKVAFVTGANRGIGKAIVESLLQHGAKKVYLGVRNPESTKALEDQYGHKVTTIQTDISSTDSVNKAAAEATDVDLVVNNAGIMLSTTPLAENVFESLAREIDVNVYGLVRIANAFAKALERNKGALVQLNSVVSMKNFLQETTYSASKAASYSITQGLKDAFAEKGVQVLSVHPGPIETDMGKRAGFDNLASAESVSEGIIDSLEKGDFLLFPDDMAKMIEGVYQSYADNIILKDFS
ncbi:SDR family oxidoreductase [Pseudoalteromonas sp. R86517]|uniref:SDR family oxidoreductase n=1 Tax=Pseudoalteromonas sp. R86517 TaxID=3093857 RepID=UPI00366CA107